MQRLGRLRACAALAQSAWPWRSDTVNRRCELSHALLDQNTTLIKAFGRNRTPSLNEGVAVAFARQCDYFTRAQFLEMAARVDVGEYIDPSRPARDWNARFAYPAQRYLVEFLKHVNGEGAFVAYLHAANAAPEQTTALFRRHFPVLLTEAIGQYREQIRTGAWPPAE